MIIDIFDIISLLKLTNLRFTFNLPMRKFNVTPPYKNKQLKYSYPGIEQSGAKGTCERFGGLNLYGCNRNYMMCQFISM